MQSTPLSTAAKKFAVNFDTVVTTPRQAPTPGEQKVHPTMSFTGSLWVKSLIQRELNSFPPCSARETLVKWQP
jgi:hypothetical protein